MEGIIWLAVLIIMLVVEIITLGLTTIWFAGGALVAFFAYLLGAGIPLQAALFVVVSLALLIGTRPFAVKYLKVGRYRTNVESLLGAEAIVLEDIDNLKARGRVQVNGQEWSAKTDEPDGYIGKNTVVVIDGIQGVKLIVREKEEKK